MSVTFEVSFVVLNALWEPVAIGSYIPFRSLSCSIVVFRQVTRIVNPRYPELCARYVLVPHL